MNKPFLHIYVKTSQWIQDMKPVERGQGLTEYAMILSFVVILLIVLLHFFGDQVDFTYRDILDKLPF